VLRRPALVSLASLLICACNTPDAALGVDGPSEKDPTLKATKFTTMTRVDLGTLGGASSYASDINSANTVVGWSETAAGSTHAFRWSAGGGMVDLGSLPGDAMSQAIAILDGGTQDGGVILGVSGDFSHWTPVVWSASGSISALPIPLLANSTNTFPTGFNSQGDVVGSDFGGGGPQHAWIWSAADGKRDLSELTDPGTSEGFANGISASGLAVLTNHSGSCTQNPQCWRTYLWGRGNGVQSLGTPVVDAEASVMGLAVNEVGTVVGWIGQGVTPATAGTIPYRWSPSSGFTLLENYSSDHPHGVALAVNSSGTAVGSDFDPALGTEVASIWLGQGTITRLSSDDPATAVAINDRGTIAGWAAVSPGVNHASIWDPSALAAPFVVRTSPSATAFVSTASSGCVADIRSIKSRQALFACVIKADHKR
jgi:probable HAF family extracellular repeat protein